MFESDLTIESVIRMLRDAPRQVKGVMDEHNRLFRIFSKSGGFTGTLNEMRTYHGVDKLSIKCMNGYVFIKKNGSDWIVEDWEKVW